MVAEPTSTTPDQEFVTQFNSNLAEAKAKALSLLSAIVAGAEVGEVPHLRERRLAASQVLRTAFLKIDEEGSIREDRSRRKASRHKDTGLADATHGTRSFQMSPAHPQDSSGQASTFGTSPDATAPRRKRGDGSGALAAHCVRGSSGTPSADSAALREMNPDPDETIAREGVGTLRGSPRAPV